MNEPSRPASLLAFPLLLATAAYARTIGGEFQFDDVTQIERYAGIKRIDWAAPWTGWLHGGRPVTDFTFALNYAVGRLEPAGYHAVNLAIHLAAALLAWALTRRVARLAGAGRGDWIALGVAGAFALHPMQTEAVSYVVQRSESLASALYLGALLLLLEAERLGRSPRGAAAFAGALASFLLALGAKPIAITMPAAYLLVTAALAGAPEARRQLTSWSRRAMLILPFVAAAALHGTRTAAALDARAGAGFDLPGLSPWLYLLTEARALAVYVRLLAWPAGQSVDWHFPASRSLAEPAVLASGAFALTLLAAAAALLVAGRRREGAPGGAARLAGLGLAWWFLVLSVTSSIVPLADTLAEHRVYLASWGLFAATAAGLERLTASLDARRTKAAALVLVAVLCCLAFLTWRRNAVWQTREALWRNVIERNPEHARARLSLGYALAERGRYDDAIVEYEAAVAFAREDPAMKVQALRNLGAAHAAAGRRDAAILAYRRGLALAPDEGDLLVNLGAALLASGDPAAAEPPIRRALEVSPSHAVAWNVLGALLLARRDYADALRAFDRAAALNPDFGEFHLNRAATLDALGRREEACAARREALMGRLMPRDRDRAERILATRCN